MTHDQEPQLVPLEAYPYPEGMTADNFMVSEQEKINYWRAIIRTYIAEEEEWINKRYRISIDEADDPEDTLLLRRIEEEIRQQPSNLGLTEHEIVDKKLERYLSLRRMAFLTVDIETVIEDLRQYGNDTELSIHSIPAPDTGEIAGIRIMCFRNGELIATMNSVKDQYRRRGYGTALVVAGLHELKQRGFDRMDISRPSDDAKRILINLGIYEENDFMEGMVDYIPDMVPLPPQHQ